MANHTKEMDSKTPRWANRANHLDHKPSWISGIPDGLWGLGEVFFPIPPLRKGWNYPHHMNSHRYGPDSEILNAYLEQGWGYGIACAGNLAVIDIDDESVVDDVVSELPETAWQMSGSRGGYHLFYEVPGLNTRINLHEKFIEMEKNKDDVWVHVGEVKCDPHGYVVGPGSTHPSGNEYGPLRGGEIATITKWELEKAVENYIKPDEDPQERHIWRVNSSPPTTHEYYPVEGEENGEEITILSNNITRYSENGEVESEAHDFYSISASDVLPWLERGKRISHPVHGSTTGGNFMMNDDGETFTCWRCSYGQGSGCGLNGTQFLAVEATSMDCEDVRRYWNSDPVVHYEAWLEAINRGLISARDIPYRALQGYAVDQGVIERGEKLAGGLYHEVLQVLRWEHHEAPQLARRNQ